MAFIGFFKMMTIEFDRVLKTSKDFCRVCKCMDDFYRLWQNFIDIDKLL